jgi:hypothetical protein
MACGQVNQQNEYIAVVALNALLFGARAWWIAGLFQETSIGHETKSFERCKAILMFGGFGVSREYFADVSDAARLGLDGQHCKTRFSRPLLDVPT